MANATIAVEGLEAKAFVLLPPQDSAWYSWFFEERYAQASGGATSAASSVDILAAQGVLIATGAALIALDGQQSTGSLGEPSASGQGVAGIDGLESQTEFGEVTASESVDSTATVTGLTLNATAGTVKAETVSPETIVGGSWHKRYPASIQKSAVAKIAGLGSIIEAGSVRAMGVVQISVVANLQPLQAVTELTPTQANGVLDLSDDEILLLLAA